MLLRLTILRVSLPTWEDIVSYMKQDALLHGRLQSDYPRFYHHVEVERLGNTVLQHLTNDKQLRCLVFPSLAGAARCCTYFIRKSLQKGDAKTYLEIWSFQLPNGRSASDESKQWSRFVVGWFGEGISGRHAMFCNDHVEDMEAVLVSHNGRCVRFSPYLQSPVSTHPVPAHVVPSRKLDLATKQEIKSLITEWISPQHPGARHVRFTDVFLFCKGMVANSTIARILLETSRFCEAVVFGWPYGSTPNAVQETGFERYTFYSQGSSEELDLIEKSLHHGKRIACLSCEVPSNPLCTTPDLMRIRSLADQYHFAVVCDETIGTFVNVDVLPLVDAVVTCLTKLFSGGCNVMAGSIVLNNQSRFYERIQATLAKTHEDLLFSLDAEILLENYVDFPGRVRKTNQTAMVVVNFLLAQPKELIRQVNYPTKVKTASVYEKLRRKPQGGYGPLISIVFHSDKAAKQFYNAVDLCKGPSFGADFTLVLPYSQLAHAYELDWAEALGMPKQIFVSAWDWKTHLLLLRSWRMRSRLRFKRQTRKASI
ncbi:PLP-dependent transferase [Melanomma pulvis-pyrius CBS 109.77]|uniref:PLP-dependent transferase n=1 Tax=Melanomma pulvis-pyrius CBS 109.77 TaxID=1314802 RepID=A0A6A6WVY1_9PLEO|nr:PLP-dependent transferase [Melanomma pulvis-pyrius CBS 109.77]